MKNWIKKIWAWILATPTIRLVAFICGETLAALFAITLPKVAEWAYFVVGGLIIQILSWL